MHFSLLRVMLWLVASPEFSSVMAGLTVSGEAKEVEFAMLTLLMRTEVADELLMTNGRVLVIELADQESICTGRTEDQ